MAVVRGARVAPGGAAWSGYSSATPPEGAWPVEVSGRDVLTSGGTSWRAVGDAPWSLIGGLSTSQITTYLEDRASKGFGLVMFTAPEFYYANNAPNNYYDDAPFTGTAFASSLNDDYWQVVDHAVEESLRLGITCLICPAYTGQQVTGDGVIPEFTNASTANAYSYGQALGARYKDFPNIMWLAGHDEDPQAFTGLVDRYVQLQLGVKAAGDAHLWIPGSGGNTEGRLDWGSTSMVWDLDQAYTRSGTVVDDMRALWDRTPPLPTVFLEGYYENEFSSTGLTHRYQMWGAFVAGGVLSIFGNSPIWHFNAQGGETWTGHLDDPSTVDMQYPADVLAAHDWGGTAPDTTDTFLTGGESTGSSRAGAIFRAGLALVYMPSAREVTLDLTEIGSTCRITRIDPTSGAESVLTSSASGSGYAVSSQGNNAGGDSDWALLVDAL